MSNIININVNKTDLGLNNVDNTSDLNKPISTATQTALNGKEDKSNKSTDVNLGTSDTLYPTQKAVKTYTDNILGNANALIYKGVIDCSTNPNYPAANAGELYIVSVAGKIGGASGNDVEVGDMLICNTDSTASGNQATVGAYWNAIQKNIEGYIIGPASSTNNTIAIFDGATGKLLKQGIITDTGSLIGVSQSIPTAKLHVNNTGSDDSFRIDDETSDTTPFIVKSDGSVGIGTANPDSKLVILGVISRLSYVPESLGGELYVRGNTSITRIISQTAATSLRSQASSMMLMRAWEDTTLAGFGNQGDATFAADSKANGLNIINFPDDTNLADDYIRLYAGKNATSTPDIHIQGKGATQGNIGINTTTPLAKLDVNGDVKIQTISNATTDTDKFLVSDSGVVKYRTGAELLSDINGASKDLTLDRKTASYTLVSGDNGKMIEMNVGSANTLTIDASIFSAGNQILISQYGAGQTTITAGAGVTLRSSGGKLKTSAQYSLVTIVAISSTEFYIAGDLTA